MEITNNLRMAIVAYKNGDLSAFDTIYNESNRYIYVCASNVLNGNDNKEDMIQDVMQDTYVEISKHLFSLDNDERFLSWAGTIATRKCYETIKKNGKYVYLGEDENFDNLAEDDNIIPEEIVQNAEKQRLIRNIIQNELTEAQRLCIVGFYYNDMKQSEIAMELGMPENTVKSNLLRAKARIKEAVVELAEKKDTKLYSLAPFMLLLFADEINACIVPQTVTSGVAAAVGTTTVSVSTGAAVTGATVSSVGTVATSMQTASAVTQVASAAVGLGIKAKIAIVATSAILGIGAIAGGVVAVNSMNQRETQRDTSIESELSTKVSIETEQVTEKEEENVIVQKDIVESDYALYEKSIEWLLFDKRSNVEFKNDMAKYSEYISSDLLEVTLQKRGTTEFNSMRVFPIFKQSGDKYVVKSNADNNKVFGTYSEMIASMPTDQAQTYYLSYFNNELTKDEVVQYVMESQGYTNISIKSVDNEKRVMEIYDSVHCCYYICEYNIEGKITSISVNDKNKKQYRTIYDFLKDKIKENEKEKYDQYKKWCGVRDFDDDGKLEIFMYADGETLEIFQYENDSIELIYEVYLSYNEWVLGFTEEGYLMDISFYLDEVEYYKFENGNVKATNVEELGDKQKVIEDTLYGRDGHYLDSTIAELFAVTHGIKEDMEREQAEKNKDWVTAYRNFLLEYDSEELIDQYIPDWLATAPGGGTERIFLI